MSIISSIITVYCGIFYVADVTQTLNSTSSLSTATKDAILASGLELSTPNQFLLFIVILVANLVFLIYWGIKFF